MLDTLTEVLTDLMLAGGSPALVVVMVLENLFPPIPSEAVLPLAGFLVARGDMNLVEALVASTLGSVLGAWALYALGRYGGRPVLRRLRFSERDLDRADRWFDRHGPWFVFFGRMVPLLRSVISVPAGASEMPLVKFVMLTALGSALWNALLIGGGMALGANYDRVVQTAEAYSDVALVLLAAGAVAGVVWLSRRKARRRKALVD